MTESGNELRSRGERALRAYGPVCVVYLLATWLTNAAFMGDTDDYVDSAVAYFGGTDYRFWEFGHLFWRPLGWLLTRAWLPLTERFVGTDIRLNVTLTFLILNWLSGLLCVVALCALLRRVCERAWIVNVVTVAFIFTNGFLNYAQTGCSYVPGLAFLILGLYFLARDSHQSGRSTWRNAVPAGMSLAVSVCLWFLYAWAIPAALLAPLFLSGFDKRQRRLVWQATLVGALFGGVAYLAVILHLRIGSLAELRAWIAPQGAPDIKGVSRMLFGFARSLIYMGNDGAMLKRYLIQDPFNSVSLADVFRLSLWKFVLFYLFLAATLGNLLRSGKGRRVLGFFVASGVPVIGFAIVFLGGDLERYFPIYPALFLVLACSLCDERALRPLKIVSLVFVAAMIVTNARASATFVLERQQEQSAARVVGLRPLLKPQSRVYAVNWQDELINFKRSFPFHPFNRDGQLRLNAVVTPSSPWLPRWRSDFAAETLNVWQAGGDVWLSKRALHPRPRVEWNWVEGDDRRISWTHLHQFFSQLELGQTASGDDGFVRIEHTPRNEQTLRGFVEAEKRENVR